ncbi:hypothetical protein P3T36_002670 [Kitasatospora sp. MAP12-15]|uniref:YfhO family protein n=1 Tax=unclassified Kitasatospora TaxID=2633591 RepID=UPI002474CCEA|nr:YfhO family protein [Kitasatospora sp. MAP12-44]MDH6112953.1 hypothetical protein [Kitasatospora sp. MAP12-44]
MRESRAAAGAAGLAMGAYALALALRGTYPFGGRAGPAERFVPLYAHLWDLLHGNTSGDLLFSWGSGYGVPFLPDLFTSLLNPFSWLVALLPRSGAAVAVFLTTLLSIGLGTALMTVFLGRLQPGPPWLRALLAVGYGLCAWALVDGAGTPAWLWGLVSLPLICLAFDWCLRRERWVLGTLCVAAAWAGDFYTALAASLGAGLLLLLRLALAGPAPRARLRSLGRAVAMTAVGVGLTAPVLLVTFRAGQAAQPVTVFRPATPGFTDYLAQALPGGRSGRALPNVFVGVPGLLLVAALPFHRAVPVRERIGWCLLLVLVALAFVWRPMVLLWHVATAPEGNPYRSTFVLGGLLTMVAWSCLSRRPDLLALAGGVAGVAALAVLAHGRGSARPITWVLLGVGVPVLVGALWLLSRGTRRETAVAAVALTCVVAAGSSWTACCVTARPAHPRPPDGAQVRAAYRLIRDADHWPAGRTDPGPHEFTGNDPLLIGGQGGGYESGYLPALTAQTLHALGAGWYRQGQQTLSLADPVGQALFAVTGSLDQQLVLRRLTAPPLVTVHGATALDTSSVWSRQQALLGSTVYQIPAPQPFGAPAPSDHGSSGWSIPATASGAAATGFTASCTPGSAAYFYGPWFAGTVTGPGGSFAGAGQQNATAMPIHPLGAVPADGRIRLELRSGIASQVPALPVACLDAGALAAAVGRLTAGGAVAVRAGGHTISAVLPPGSTGTALFALPVVTGWSCAVDGGRQRTPLSAEGLLAVPLGAGASRVACRYRQPGLADGLTVSAGAAAVLLAVAVASRLRGRRLSRGGR